MNRKPQSAPRTRKYAGPVRLDGLAQACLGPAVSRFGFGSAQIIATWSEIAGHDLGARTRPERIRWPRQREEGPDEGATLIVRAEGADALEVQLRTGEIAERINAFFGWRAVTRIAIRQAPVPAPARPAASAPAATREPRPRTPEVEAVADEGLRESLRELGHHVATKRDKSA